MKTEHPDPKIISLRPSGYRYKVKISGRDEPLLVGAELVHRHRLKEGIVLTPAQVEQLKDEAEELNCLNTANRILAVREHSTGEIKDKLRRRKFSATVVESTLKDLKRRGLLDDAHVAAKLVEQSLAKNPSGRAYLFALLRRKKIAPDLAEQTVSAALDRHDELDLALTSLKKKWPAIRQLELERARTKAYTYLSRRGISYQAARKAFEQMYHQQDEVTDD
jgi:regulatory protein